MPYTTLLFHFLESAIRAYTHEHFIDAYAESGQSDNAQPKVR